VTTLVVADVIIGTIAAIVFVAACIGTLFPSIEERMLGTIGGLTALVTIASF